MPLSGTKGPMRSRGTYSRLICLGCRERRIRCELPTNVETPDAGELRTTQTPCYRCKRLGVPCIVRKTILGRPSTECSSTTTSGLLPTRTDHTYIGPRIIIDLSSGIQSTDDQPLSQWKPVSHGKGRTLLIHTPQSTETVIIIRALDTIRREKVEGEWFRHLPAHVGHTQALDLSIKALVAACAYARDIPQLTSRDCYQALALALRAVQSYMNQSLGELSDDILASTALLAPFEGVLNKHGVPTCLHVEGLAAILAARPSTFPITQLAREIFDFYACDSAIMACIQGVPSPFETVSRGYFASGRIACNDSDRAKLKAFGSELFVRIPRLVGLARTLRLHSSPQIPLLSHAFSLSKSLLQLQDPQAEERLLRTIILYPTSRANATSPVSQSLHFTSVDDFEALAYYWQNRLTLLRLEHNLHELAVSGDTQVDDGTDEPRAPLHLSFRPRANEVHRLVKNILMCADYAATLPLRKHDRLFSYAMVIVWGVMMDVPTALAHLQSREGVNALSSLLLRNVNLALSAKPPLTFEDMDMAADIFVGGQPKGRFVKLYGL